MTIAALVNATILFGAVDVSMDSNDVSLDATVDELDDTTFGTGGFRSKRGGLKIAQANIGGFLNLGPGNSEEAFFANIGGQGVAAMTVSPTGTDGDPAYLFEPIEMKFDQSAPLGQMAGFKSTVVKRGKYGVVRGYVLKDRSAAVIATGNGTGRQLGAVPSGKKLHASLHVLAASGTTPTLDVVVESDDNAGFTSPTTRLTFTQKTAAGSQFVTPLAGPVTDDWYRAKFTVAGTTPSFTFLVAVGIQ